MVGKRGLGRALLVVVLVPALVRAEKVADDVRTAIATDGEVRVIVNLVQTPTGAKTLASRRTATAAVQSRVMRRLDPTRFRMAHRFQAVPAFAGTVNAEGLEALIASPEVASVVLDAGGTGALANSVPHIRADVMHSMYGLTGAGVTVGVIDTGFDSDHPDLAGALVGEQCFCSTNGGCCPNGGVAQSGAGAAEDDHSHGTHVSGIVTSDGNVASVGVAPDASIVAVKVIAADNTFCCISDVIAGMDWIANNRPDVKVVNMSLGTSALYSGTCDALDFNPAVAAAVNNLKANGVSVFVAAMNNGNANAMDRLPASPTASPSVPPTTSTTSPPSPTAAPLSI